MSAPHKWIALGLTLVLGGASASVVLPACSKGDSSSAHPIDTEVMAFLSEARALHHQADLAEQNADPEGAIRAMDRLVRAQRPHPETRTPEVEEVLADAHARRAELHVRRGELDLAAAAVKSGLEHAPGSTYFRGHLVEMQGLVEEARAATLADAGKSAEAARAREQAIRLLEEVVKIQDDVIKRSLSSDAGAQAPR